MQWQSGGTERRQWLQEVPVTVGELSQLPAKEGVQEGGGGSGWLKVMESWWWWW